MLKFRHFITEMASLRSSGPRLDYEKTRYIDPHLPGGSAHGNLGMELGQDHKLDDGTTISAGEKVNAHGITMVKGRRHLEVETQSGVRGLVPASKIKKPRESISPFSDEHAMKHVWNHFVSSNKDAMQNENHMLDEIKKAKTDPNHPLSFEKASTAGFEGGNKKEGYREHYFKELSHAARTITDMSKHPDFKDAISKGHTAEVIGREKPKLSKLYKEAGVKHASAVSKADLNIGGRKISLKKGDSNPTQITHESEIKGAIRPFFTKGKHVSPTAPLVMRMTTKTAQIASSGPEEFKAMHYHALSKLGLKQGSDEHTQAKEKIDKIANIMRSGPENHKEKIGEINSIYRDLHHSHPDLGKHLTREAITGEGKFEHESGQKPLDYIVTTRRQ